ncbi:hypothetical protein C8Q76DRAFT_790873 [Earliella scabrosa]|nr:hypothetical protein C8Q76DRAFT_790873 [Earliella scabrosa]
MKFTAVLVSLAVAAGSYAVFTPRDAAASPCPGAKAVRTSSVDVNGKSVEVTTFSCAAQDPAPAFRNLAAQATDVCNELCQFSCSHPTSLPPTSEDCNTIVAAVTILNGSVPASFDVSPNHAQTLTFGTCRFAFLNFGATTLSFCWLSLAQQASAAGAACFPQNTEGDCVATTGLWRVTAGHS